MTLTLEDSRISRVLYREEKMEERIEEKEESRHEREI